MKNIASYQDIQLHLLFCIHILGELAMTVIYQHYKLQESIVNVLYKTLLIAANKLHIDITKATNAKISLNDHKYPIHLLYGKIQKYTAYSSETHITKNSNQFVNDGIYINTDIRHKYITLDHFYLKLPLLKEKVLEFTKL